MREVLELVDNYLSVRGLHSDEFQEWARQFGYFDIEYLGDVYPLVIIRRRVKLGDASPSMSMMTKKGYMPSTLTIYDGNRNYTALLNPTHNVVGGWRQRGEIGELLYPHQIRDEDVPVLTELAKSLGMQPELPPLFQNALEAVMIK